MNFNNNILSFPSHIIQSDELHIFNILYNSVVIHRLNNFFGAVVNISVIFILTMRLKIKVLKIYLALMSEYGSLMLLSE